MNTLAPSTARSARKFLVAILALGTAHQAISAEQGRAFYAATNGTDTSTCGASGNPCRSISQAFENAAEGGTVLVRPGLYGDLNNDGAFDRPGEERPKIISGTSCMICVVKGVQIRSTHGAFATFISTGDEPHDAPAVAVSIFADGVTLGGRGRGFTLTGSSGEGVIIRGAGNVKVIGNIVQRGISAAACHGPIHLLENLIHDSGGNALQTVRSGEPDCYAPGPIFVRDNVATENAGVGFNIVDSDIVRFSRNVSTRNLAGAHVIGGGTLSDSVFIGNRTAGIVVSAGGATLLRNSIISNDGPGIWLNHFVTVHTAFHENNIYGNGRTTGPEISNPAAINCGIFNESASTVGAERNFWGSSSGPGADPADLAGPNSGCDVAQGLTTVTPFSANRFPIQP